MLRLRRAWQQRTRLPAALLWVTGLWGGVVKAQPPAAQRGEGTPLVFRDVTVIDVTTGRRLQNQTVVVQGNRIQAVGPVRATRVQPGATVVDARGKYLIPGLWDMHTHDADSATYRAMALAGITGFRVAGTENGNVKRYRDMQRDILAGKTVGPPRQIISARLMSLDSALIDRAKEAGADMFKVYQQSRTSYFQAAHHARRLGLPYGFGGHIGPVGGRFGNPKNPDSSSVTAEEISDSGATIIDHVGLDLSGGLDTLCVRNSKPAYQRGNLAACRQAAEHLRRNGTWWVPTLIELLQVPRVKQFDVHPVSAELVTKMETNSACDVDVRPDSSGLLGIAYRAGMPLLAGTDAMGVGGAPATLLHRELEAMVSEGLPPLAALQTATLNPAKFLHATDSLGTVAPGKLADLVLLDDDPLTNISNTTHVRAVVINGWYYKGERPCRTGSHE